MKSYYIQTDRLLLRDWLPEDVEPFTEINQDSRVMEFFPSKKTLEITKRGIAKYANHIDKHGYGFFAVELLETQEFIGSVGLAQIDLEVDFAPGVEIGWRLGYPHWGKGYATEAARASLDFGFNHHGLEEIYSFTATVNKRSENVMKKLGLTLNDEFDHPKIQNGHPLQKHILYKIVKNEYLN